MKSFIPISKGISSKVNAIERVELELAYYDVTFPHVNHYATKTFPINIKENIPLTPHLYAFNPQMIMINCKQLYVHVTILNTNNLHIIIWLQVFVSNTNNLPTVI